ncbi:DUF6438 domain-containing protein [Bacteroidota bacterium]
MRRVALFSLLAASLSFGCKTSKKSVQSEQPQTVETRLNAAPVLLASIERTACYGKCPMYKITYMDNGEVTYVGKRFVDSIGSFSTLLNEKEIALIKEKATALGYFKLDTLYPTPVSDFPSCITEVQFGGKQKRIVDKRNPPQNLKSFEDFLDSLIRNKALRKESDNRDYNQR